MKCLSIESRIITCSSVSVDHSIESRIITCSSVSAAVDSLLLALSRIRRCESLQFALLFV